MSTNPDRIPLPEAQALAASIVELLRPHCERIEAAGSIRREKKDVGDIEIVCIPRPVTLTNLLGETVTRRNSDDLTARLLLAGYRLIKNGEKYKQADLGPCMLDLFITEPECWGVILAIRTGPADFSHRLVTPRNQGGLLPSFLQVKEGRLQDRSTGVQLNTREEIDLFNAIDLKWIDPSQR